MNQVAYLLALSIILAADVAAFPQNQNGRIINGEKASEGQFPWQVGIYLKALQDKFYCGGAIIDQSWVLTAGHCVPGINVYKVVAGVTNIKDTNSTHRVEMYSDEYYRPFEYNPFTLQYDLALIKLPEKLEFNEYIQPIRLTESDPEVGSDITISGWGFVDADLDIVSPDLMYTSLSVISQDDCKEYFPDLYDGAFCAMYGDNFTNPCNGDSGGPIVQNSTDGPVQVGIVSFGSNLGCLAEYPTGYTRVTYFRDWIRNITGF